MQSSSAEDYGLADGRENAAHVPPFKLTPTGKPPKPPYELRRQIFRCIDAGLTSFDKNLFDRLTDMAHEPEFRRGEGVLECSKKYLADDCGKDVSTVTRAARRMEKAGFVWTQTRWNGAIETTWWFIREWADDSKEYPAHTGPNFGRRRRGVQRNTERARNGKFVPNPNSMRSRLRALMAAHGLTDATVKAGLHPDHGQKSTLTTGTSAPGQGATAHPVHGQESTLTGRNGAPGQGAATHPDRERPRTRTGRTDAPGHGAKVTGLSNLRDDYREGDGDTFKRSTVVNAARAGGKKTPIREKTFLLDVAAAMERWQKGAGKKEMTNSGAWWRLAYRADADLIERVLADTLAQIKECKIKKHPGAHAVDLWQRWGGKLEATR